LEEEDARIYDDFADALMEVIPLKPISSPGSATMKTRIGIACLTFTGPHWRSHSTHP